LKFLGLKREIDNFRRENGWFTSDDFGFTNGKLWGFSGIIE